MYVYTYMIIVHVPITVPYNITVRMLKATDLQDEYGLLHNKCTCQLSPIHPASQPNK